MDESASEARYPTGRTSVGGGRVPSVIRAHGRSYRIHENTDPTAGKAAATTTQLMRLGQPYERPLLEHIHNLGLSGTAVDVGANVGNHTLWFAAICGLRVHAFEPIVPNELQANIQANRLDDRVMVHAVALGDQPARLQHAGMGRLDPTRNVEGGFIVRTLDSYQLTDVALVKIDVEGMEPYVLRGGETTIRRDRPVIFAEEWDDHSGWHDAIAEVLEPWGYEMTYRFSGREAATPVGKWEYIR